jgi:microcystin-dependent protein
MKKTALFAALLCLAQISLHAAVPLLLNYQGKVFDSAGLPLGSTGSGATLASSPINRKIIFRIWDASSNGNLKWSEEQTATISLGEFSVVLGNGAIVSGLAAGAGSLTIGQEQALRGDLSEVFASGAERFLEITVDDGSATINASDIPVSPRQQITSTGYAFHAKVADQIIGTTNLTVDPVTGIVTAAGEITGASIKTTGAGSITGTHVGNGAQLTSLAGGSITTNTVPLAALVDAVKQALCPPGTVVAYMGSAPPAGWLLCNGASINRNDYASLYAVIGDSCGSENTAKFNLPDLRGRFLRGWDNGIGRDPDRAARIAMATGGFTGDKIGSIQADAFKNHTHPITDTYTNSSQTSAQGGTGNTGATGTLEQADTTANSSTGGSETRPINAYVNYIIKF